MNAPLDANVVALTRFGIGQPVSRKEDPMLLRGKGRYTDGLNLSNQVYAVRTSGSRP